MLRQWVYKIIAKFKGDVHKMKNEQITCDTNRELSWLSFN